MNSYTACAIFMGSPSESDIAADRAMRRLYRSLLGVDTAPGIPHHFGELIAIDAYSDEVAQSFRRC